MNRQHFGWKTRVLAETIFSNVWSFIILRSAEDLTSFNKNNPHGVNVSGEKKYNEAFLGCIYFFRIRKSNLVLVDAICGLSLLLVLSLVPRRFSPGAQVFPSPQKPTFLNSNSTRNQVDEEPLCGCATCKSLFIYLFILVVFVLESEGLFKILRQHVWVVLPRASDLKRGQARSLW